MISKEFFVNDWSQASLQEELNSTYLNSIPSLYQEMIDNAVWNLGGSDTSDDVTTAMFYERERGTTVYTGRPTEWTGKIGLMYPSDYGYATSGGNIGRDTCLSYDLGSWAIYSGCRTSDWLQIADYISFMLTPSSSNITYVHVVRGSYGQVVYRDDNFLGTVFPVLYLSSNVKITGGDGSSFNPFILSL